MCIFFVYIRAQVYVAQLTPRIVFKFIRTETIAMDKLVGTNTTEIDMKTASTSTPDQKNPNDTRT